jgi:hypothetical protein
VPSADRQSHPHRVIGRAQEIVRAAIGEHG